MVQPQMPAMVQQPPQPPQWDPNFLAYMNQQLAQFAQATGGQWKDAPPPVQPMEWPEAFHAIAARAPWHSEEDHNRVRDALVRFVADFQQLQQDLAAIRARIPVLAAPVTPAQQQVLDTAGQAPAAPQFPFPGFVPQATVAAPWPQFGPTGQPVPPASAQPPAPATFPPGFFPPGFQPPGAPVGG